MHCRYSPRRTCNPCGYSMKISFMYQRSLIYDVKINAKIDGMGPFSIIPSISMGIVHFSELLQNILQPNIDFDNYLFFYIFLFI